MGYPRTVPPKSNSAPKSQSQSQSRSDPLASSCNLTDPIFSANSFPKFTDLFCRLFLPTLLYWPEAAHLGDLLWLWVWMDVKINLSLGFSRAFKSAPDTRKSVVLYWPWTYLLAIRFYGVRSLTRKENSSQGSCWCLRVQLRYHKSGPKGPEYLDQKVQNIHVLVWEYWHNSLSINGPWLVTLKRSFPISWD